MCALPLNLLVAGDLRILHRRHQGAMKKGEVSQQTWCLNENLHGVLMGLEGDRVRTLYLNILEQLEQIAVFSYILSRISAK